MGWSGYLFLSNQFVKIILFVCIFVEFVYSKF